jgi:phage shock protein C
MYCNHCGNEVRPDTQFCPKCGAAQAGARAAKRLIRPLVGRKIGGVCLALANYWSVDPTLVRVIWVVATLLPPFPGIIVYLICWIVMPAELDHPVVTTVTSQSGPSAGG